ncbi:ribonuclease H-like domain-containing protein [Biscogniauxia marginata]|nr:ribonuclease H-like domain-containing protein [Biscogniauxia marginata]
MGMKADAQRLTESGDVGHPGRKCECRLCILKVIHCEARDEPWLRKKQSPRQLPLDLRILNAKYAMLKDGFYIPTTFDPEPFLNEGELATPQQLFPESLGRWTKFPGFTAHRFVLHRKRPVGPRLPIKMQLIYTDGACMNDGSSNAIGGVGVAFCSKGRVNTKGCIGSALEACGPDGQRIQPTSNRAELRAVVKALEWRYWYREGWEALVIATGSVYVAQNATIRLSSWLERKWYKSNGEKATNRDLWKRLLYLFRLYAIHGCEVMIWHISRDQNTIANTLAKDGITRGSAKYPTRWSSRRDPLLKQDLHFNF